MQALVLPKITSYKPNIQGTLENYKHLANLDFADDPNSQDEVQMLIGADIYGMLILNDIRKGQMNQPIAQHTIFGRVLSGPLDQTQSNLSSSISVHLCNDLEQLSTSMTKFWELEEIPAKRILTPEDEQCELHFLETHRRDSDGRYIVRIPFKENSPPEIGKFRHIAEKSLGRLVTRLNRNPIYKELYVQFIQEYENLGHMNPVDIQNQADSAVVLLPHHPVFRDTSQTTKLRIVFNASSKTSNGTSINDHMLIGPKLQAELPQVISQWRTYRYALTADIAKMYRQIWVNELDRTYQHILWREALDTPIIEYALATVTYGTRSAPFMALRVLKQLVVDEGTEYPLASQVLNNDIYVDDLLFGAHDLSSAMQVRNEVITLLGKAKLEPRKWASNETCLLQGIDSSNHGLAWNLEQSDGGIKILGLTWNPDSDMFYFSVKPEPLEQPTKRKVLSFLFQLYDPLGWISPVIIAGKIMMQNLWRQKLQWDKVLPPACANQWLTYHRSLQDLSKLAISRWTHFHPVETQITLHGFADASELAYGAVIYSRSVNKHGEVRTTLIISKSKVAPIKKISTPRLELQAALLLAKLITYLKEVRSYKDIPVQCWSDSSVVLHWLRKHSSSWKLYVSNRVSEIQTLLPNQKWKYVPTSSNPADLISRGLSPQSLCDSSLWWNGPPWLSQDSHHWPSQHPLSPPTADLEIKIDTHHATSMIQPLNALLLEFSSWLKTLHVAAYILRFLTNLKSRPTKTNVPPSAQPQDIRLSSHDVAEAKLLLYRLLQAELFAPELKDLNSKKSVDPKSKLAPLVPFLDKAGIIRVGGRLDNATLPFETKHPVILGKHPLVSALIRETHLRCLHGGLKITLSTLRQSVWIINPRPLIKSVLHNCVTCIRLRAHLASQLMAPLPNYRVSREKHAFVHCGLDYAGPLQVRMAGGRGHKSQSCFIAVFVCLAVKAIHLEVVTDYSSAMFIAAYKRFVSRRGSPSHIHSDRGTTFQGADRALREEFTRVITGSEFQNLLVKDEVTWHYIPPAAPHFGGIWEAGVKSVKTHLKRVLVNSTPTYEELATLLCQIEAVLNSRPLGPYSDSVEDLDPLTPGHFLVGGPLNAVPQVSVLDVSENRLTRWQRIQQQLESFWDRWALDYVQSLHHRTKWRIRESSVKVGQLVLLRKPNMPPAKWNMARILECYPGGDGCVRVVKIKTSESEYTRPITEIVMLPSDLESDNTSVSAST